VDANRWAARALDRVRGEVEARRTDLLTGEATFSKGGERATTLFHLAICSRLRADWHRDAALQLLATAGDLPSFVGHRVDPDSGYNYGLNGLMISRAAQEVCFALDFLQDVPEDALVQMVERVLVPIGERLMNKIRRGGSNWQAMENLALLCIGLTAGRQDFIEVVRNDPARSYAYHLANSVHPDGFWYEQSLGYHAATTDHLLKTRWIADRHSIDLGGDDVLREMIEVLRRMAMPGGQLPVLADAHPKTLFESVGLLEVAYAMYRIPWVGWALGRTLREDLWSLLVGADIEDRACPDVCSELFEASGVCVLKRGRAPTFWDGHGSAATITFGPHGDWHGHAGKLGIEYRYDHRYLVRDRGVGAGYALPMHRQWFTTTAAHSTLVVDGEQQHFTRTWDKPEKEQDQTGHCHAVRFAGDIQACIVSADFAYPGCQVRRALFLAPDYLLDIMDCAALDGGTRVFDWILHTDGMIQTTLPFVQRTLAFHDNGYSFFRDTRAFDTDDAWGLDIMDCSWADSTPYLGDLSLHLTVLGEPDTSVFTAWCPSGQHDREAPVVLVRRRTARTVFAALYDTRGDLTLEQGSAAPAPLAYRVSRPGVFTHTLAVTESPTGPGVTVSPLTR
jgi:hypothetical protein